MKFSASRTKVEARRGNPEAAQRAPPPKKRFWGLGFRELPQQVVGFRVQGFGQEMKTKKGYIGL